MKSLYKMETRPQSFLDELEMPFAPPEPIEKIESIKTELPKLVEVAIQKLNMDQQDSFRDFLSRMNKRKLVKKYKESHPEKYKRWHYTPTGKQLRLLRLIAFLLTYECND